MRARGRGHLRVRREERAQIGRGEELQPEKREAGFERARL